MGWLAAVRKPSIAALVVRGLAVGSKLSPQSSTGLQLDKFRKRRIWPLLPTASSLNIMPERTLDHIGLRLFGAIDDIKCLARLPSYLATLASLPSGDRFARCLIVLAENIAPVFGVAKRLLLLWRLRCMLGHPLFLPTTPSVCNGVVCRHLLFSHRRLPLLSRGERIRSLGRQA